jgi:hypothetical protein
MKIFEKNMMEEAARSLALILDSEKGSMDSFPERKNKFKKPVCDRCGYMDCICDQGSI